MHNIDLNLNLEISPWTDLLPESFPLNTDGLSAEVERIGLLPNATNQGRATVMIVVKLPDGQRVVAETTWWMFNVAAHALAASPVAEMEEM